jgi:hypothetical protein
VERVVIGGVRLFGSRVLAYDFLDGPAYAAFEQAAAIVRVVGLAFVFEKGAFLEHVVASQGQVEPLKHG